MANMTIENIGGFIQSGNAEKIIDRGVSIETPQAPSAAPAEAGSGSFSQMLKDSLDKVNEVQLQADRAAQELTAGKNKNIHETMLILEKADMSFKLAMQVRNKIIEAYREIMRMQV
ncbi:MAG: flagellar hook-basal body complex protein FliE [Bdellovibrionota bacterium]